MGRPAVRRDRGHTATVASGDPTPPGDAEREVPPRATPAVPGWAVRVLTRSAAALALAAVGWLLFWFLLRVPLVTVALAVALLLAALLQPVARWLRRRGLPPGLASLLSVLLLLAVLTGVGALVGFRAAAKLRNLARPLTAGIDRIRVWLIEGPLGLDPQRVADIRNTVVTRIYQLIPEPAAAARMALYVLAAVILVAFVLFFLLKDGERMWGWALGWVPGRRREHVDGAGRCAWTTLSGYIHGVIIVAIIDAVGIGTALFILDVPLWVSLTLLTFLGAFVPIFGATISGAVAVLVTLVTNGLTDAIIVLVVVLVVQQVEGNLLQPLIVGRTLHLHPVAILVAVTIGTLLWGLAGALLAVPLMAVAYRIAEYVREHRQPPAAPSIAHPESVPSGGSEPAPVAGAGRA
ncbi:AI-2E family transporter [Geodermatophilus sp. DF01_2]|uniref:AI-2E family transporter n=1 Tax=Geodermatophilus sp. DF01-2 TaxID=2559610 RepID=UPI0014321660|nr:AI-2E family transporter [Geodermatophilus sp. DF01_2]